MLDLKKKNENLTNCNGFPQIVLNCHRFPPISIECQQMPPHLQIDNHSPLRRGVDRIRKDSSLGLRLKSVLLHEDQNNCVDNQDLANRL